MIDYPMSESDDTELRKGNSYAVNMKFDVAYEIFLPYTYFPTISVIKFNLS